MDGRDGRAHFISRDDFILTTVIIDAFGVSGIAIRNDKYVEEQKRMSI